MDLSEPDDNFITLELFSKDKDTAEYSLKGFYIIKMDSSKEVTIVDHHNCRAAEGTLA